jgi:hypothetical protein
VKEEEVGGGGSESVGIRPTAVALAYKGGGKEWGDRGGGKGGGERKEEVGRQGR